MKAKVNDGCTGCGLCEAECPEVFRLGDDGLAEAYGAVTDANKASAQSAADSCPVSIIVVE